MDREPSIHQFWLRYHSKRVKNNFFTGQLKFLVFSNGSDEHFHSTYFEFCVSNRATLLNALKALISLGCNSFFLPDGLQHFFPYSILLLSLGCITSLSLSLSLSLFWPSFTTGSLVEIGPKFPSTNWLGQSELDWKTLSCCYKPMTSYVC